MKLLVISGETIWFRRYSRKHQIYLLSPKKYNLSLEKKTNFCHFESINHEEKGKLKIDAILWREGHLYPSKKLVMILKQIQETRIPCINKPNSTLIAMNGSLVAKSCLNNKFLAKYCSFRFACKEDLNSMQRPFVIKIPNYHGGNGKFLIKSKEDIELIKKNDKIKENKYFIVEPFLKGRDLRIYASLNRKSGDYSFITLERIPKENEWLANIHTKKYWFVKTSKEHEVICKEAAKILECPDLFAVDIIQEKNKDKTSHLLEINNDVPGLNALESINNFSIHDRLINNLEIILE
ncbi:MAG: ATP-grasp domain-containing protein, partial [Promethearchaeota archaeon]